MLRGFARHGGRIASCGTCLDARGLAPGHLIEEAVRSTMDSLAALVAEADQALTF